LISRSPIEERYSEEESFKGPNELFSIPQETFTTTLTPHNPPLSHLPIPTAHPPLPLLQRPSFPTPQILRYQGLRWQDGMWRWVRGGRTAWDKKKSFSFFIRINSNAGIIERMAIVFHSPIPPKPPLSPPTADITHATELHDI